MAHVFLSYSRKDEARALRVIKGLESYGLTVWWDWRIDGGELWRREIARRLQDCGTVVVLWTKNAVQSKAVVEEASVGSKRSVLVPLYLEQCELPYGFGEINYLSLEGWDGNIHSDSFQRVVKSVQARLEGFTPILTVGERKEILDTRKARAHQVYSLKLAGEEIDVFVGDPRDAEAIDRARAASDSGCADNASYLSFVLASYLANSASAADAINAYNLDHAALPVSSISELAQAVIDYAVPSYRRQHGVG